jgi:hypothetical protein
MTAQLTLTSDHEGVLQMVADFARGLGCNPRPATGTPGSGITANVPDESTLLELLTHIALSATKAEIDLAEPLCLIAYHHEHASSAVTLGLRLSEFRIESSEAAHR